MNDDDENEMQDADSEQDADATETDEAPCPYTRLAEIWQDLSPIVNTITAETDDDRRALYQRMASSLIREMHDVSGSIVQREREDMARFCAEIWDAIPRAVP